MVGIFPKLSARKGGHRRSKSATARDFSLLEASRTSRASLQPASSLPATADGADLVNGFAPVEPPEEHPHGDDQPVRCPPPEPSILNDGRLWKLRMSSASMRVRTELPVVKEGPPHIEARPREQKAVPAAAVQKRMLQSLSAPESSFVGLL